LVNEPAAFLRSRIRTSLQLVLLPALLESQIKVTPRSAERAKLDYADFSNLNSNEAEIAQIYDLAARASSPSITNATHSMV
jgi:hypothetical protein